MTTINLAEKYSKRIVTGFSKESYVANNVSRDYEFDGVRTVNVMTPKTVELNDYDRTKADGSRFGELTEISDSIQTLTLTKEKSFNLSIDRGNYTDQQMLKKAGRMMNLEIKEQVTPMLDKYCFEQWTNGAGSKVAVGALTEKNIAAALLAASVAMDNELVPDEDRFVYIGATNYGKLLTSPEYLNLQKLGEKAIAKGDAGTVAGMRLIKVADKYLPSDVQFLATYKGSVLHPVKLKTARILTDDSAVDGWLLQGRYYFDAFVLEAKKMGVYAALTAARD